MVFIYDLALRLYLLGISLVAPFNAKARKWLKGRRENPIPTIPDGGDVVWMHCASLGEFEQGRPLLEKLKEQYPERRILLTFFSPSGYTVRKDYALADWVLYLPMDSKKNARRLLDAFPIILAVFVKYDLWYHYLKGLEEKGAKAILISAIFRPGQFYFKWYGRFLEERIKKLSHIFVQNESTLALLESRGYTNLMLTGDTRLDRVEAISKSATTFPLVEAFRGEAQLWVFGSTWTPDIELVKAILEKYKSHKVIVAPHQIEEGKIKQLQEELSAIRYSGAAMDRVGESAVLLIDNIGMLSSLYRYARFAYVGGGFETGLHNTMEAAVYGIPVLFGPNYQKFEEARALLACGGGFSVGNRAEFLKKVALLEGQTNYLSACRSARSYVLENLGATEKILENLPK